MALRIACDLDGTLADLESALQREAERLFGAGVRVRVGAFIPAAINDDTDGVAAETSVPASTEEPVAIDKAVPRPLTTSELRRLWDHVRAIENFWTTLGEIEPGAVSRLAAMASLHGWQILFVTQRPSSGGETAQIQTQRWLEAHGFELPSVYVMHGSRGKLAEALALDAVIDDRAENALDVTTDSNAKSILIWRDTPDSTPPAATRLGIHVVYSFAEAMETLQQMMAPPSTPQRLLNRVRAAIGF